MHNSFHWPRDVMELWPMIKFTKLPTKDFYCIFVKKMKTGDFSVWPQ